MMNEKPGSRLPHPRRGFHALHLFVLGLVLGGVAGIVGWRASGGSETAGERLPLLASVNGLEISLLESVQYMRNLLSAQDREAMGRQILLLKTQQSLQADYLSQLKGTVRAGLQAELYGVMKQAHASHVRRQSQFIRQVRAGDLGAADQMLATEGWSQLQDYLELIARLRESERRSLDHFRQDSENLQGVTHTLLEGLMAACLLIGLLALIRARRDDRGLFEVGPQIPAAAFWQDDEAASLPSSALPVHAGAPISRNLGYGR